MEAINAIDIINNVDNIRARLRRRKIYKKRTDPFCIPDEEFKNKYRFNKETVRKIVNMIQNEINVDNRGNGISRELQVLTALRCWGRREVQDDAGDIHGVSQATVSRICARVARALASQAKNVIKMPVTMAEQEKVIGEFRNIRNFPGVIGAIDCTHIKIKKPGGALSQYYINRKGFYSLNVQVVCDAKLKIRDIVARWRGSTHDSRIFNESTIKQRFLRGQFRGRLLGDSGYELTPYLFTPLLRPQNPRDERYNIAQIATRNAVERCFGVWKQRFQSLLWGLTVSLENAKTVIIAMAVLHNIALEQNDPIPDEAELIADHHPLNNRLEPGVVTLGRRQAAIMLQNFIQENF